MARNDDESNPFASPEADDRIYQDEPHDGKIEYANFATRFGGAFVDGIIVSIVNFVMQLVIQSVLSNVDQATAAQWLSSLLGIVVAWLYEALQESSATQATLGKKLVGIKVTDLDGNRISFGRATGRHFGKILSFLTLFVGYLIQPFTEKRQTLHDMMAGCLVIKD